MFQPKRDKYFPIKNMPNQDKDNQSLIDVFKTRIFSPIMSGFIISWLVINWEIPYATLFLSAEDIKPINKIGYIKFIISHYDSPQLDLFWCPLLFSIGFTLLSPILKYGTDYYIEWIKKIYLKKIEQMQKNYQLLKERNQKIEESNKRIKDEFLDMLIVDNVIDFEKFMRGKWRVIFNPTHQEFNNVYYADKKFYDQYENSKLLFECEYLAPNEHDKSLGLQISKRYDDGFEGRYRLSITERERLVFCSTGKEGYDIVFFRVDYYGKISSSHASL